MNARCTFAAAAILAATAALSAGGAAHALPAGAANVAPPAGAANVAPPAAADSDAATPVYHWQQRCWPIHRWVWTHWGWRYRYVGTRCAPRYHYYRPHYRPYYRPYY